MKIDDDLTPKDIPNLIVEKWEHLSIYKMNFTSLSQLHLYLKSDPTVNKNVFYTQKSKVAPAKFAGEPLDVAIDYCIGGYERDFSVFVQLQKELDQVTLRLAPSRKAYPSVVGSRPNVPAYVAGVPKSMYRMERAQEKKFITIYMNLAYTGNTSEAQIRNRGILTLNMIKILENNHYGVNLKVFEACMVDTEIFAASIGLKKPGELLNVKKCYYPLCSKEFLRRVLSRVKESMPFQEKWHMSYGMLLNEQYTRNIMNIPKDAIIIKAPDEMGILGNDIYEDAENFWKKLHLSDKVKEMKEKRN